MASDQPDIPESKAEEAKVDEDQSNREDSVPISPENTVPQCASFAGVVAARRRGRYHHGMVMEVEN